MNDLQNFGLLSLINDFNLPTNAKKRFFCNVKWEKNNVFDKQIRNGFAHSATISKLFKFSTIPCKQAIPVAIMNNKLNSANTLKQFRNSLLGYGCPSNRKHFN